MKLKNLVKHHMILTAALTVGLALSFANPAKADSLAITGF
jgi:hypothetical protein